MLPSSFTYVAYRYLNRPVWFAARVLEDLRSQTDIENGAVDSRWDACASASVVGGSDIKPQRTQRMSYACAPSPRAPRDSCKRRTAPVGSMMGVLTPPLSPSKPTRSLQSSKPMQDMEPKPAAMVGSLLLQPARSLPTPPPRTPCSSPPPSEISAQLAVNSPLSSPTDAAETRPWEEGRSSGVAPERHDSVESTASSITTYSYEVQVVHAARVTTHGGVLASPILGRAASIKSRPSSVGRPSVRASSPASLYGPSRDSIAPGAVDDPLRGYLPQSSTAHALEPIVEVLKPAPPKASEMMWFVENISGYQFYVADSDVIAIAEAEHRRLRAQEMRHVSSCAYHV